MNPWQERSPKTPNLLESSNPPTTFICPNYPTCPKEERQYLNEVRGLGKHVPANFKLSNGLKAAEFCLHFIMQNHFKRKSNLPKNTS